MCNYCLEDKYHSNQGNDISQLYLNICIDWSIVVTHCCGLVEDIALTRVQKDMHACARSIAIHRNLPDNTNDIFGTTA